jgi:hypothetical protein
MHIMDYLKLVVAAATMAPTIVADIKKFVKAFEGDHTVVALVRTALEAVKAAAADIESILPDANETENKANG